MPWKPRHEAYEGVAETSLEAVGRAEGPAAQPLALPGYRYGMELTLKVVTGSARVGPGVASIWGQLVTVQDSVPLSESSVRWRGDRVALCGFTSTWAWTGSHGRSPGRSGHLAVGQMFPGSGRCRAVRPGRPAAAHGGERGAFPDDGDADYRCDQVADEAEIGAALRYVRLAC